MPSSQRALQSSPIPTTPPPQFSSSTAESLSVDSDVVVILAALLCALICVVGLALVARCAWLRSSSSTSQPPSPSPPSAKGLKKKLIRSLPTLVFNISDNFPSAECAICLADFSEGDQLRSLPQCGHWFHVGCIDTWLAVHSSCPSCRQVLVVARCERCGASSASKVEKTGGEEEGHSGNFLP